MNQDRILQLLVRKLAGNISPHESKELEDLMGDSREWQLSTELLMQSWSTVAEENTNAEKAFKRHLLRMQQNGYTIPEVEKRFTTPTKFPGNKDGDDSI